jgi:putative SOS response-associated peptidase YedK
MCSRFENKQTGLSIFRKLKKDLKGKFILDDELITKKINIAPGSEVMNISKDTEKYGLTNAIWGIKFDDKKDSPLIFNSRIETINEKKFWQQLFNKNKCLLPATAFYEWKEIDKMKIPHRISMPELESFYFASIFFINSENILTSIITTQPNSAIKDVHNRMPVILNENQIEEYFESDFNNSVKLCKPLDDNIEVVVEIAEDILTEKQKGHLIK